MWREVRSASCVAVRVVGFAGEYKRSPVVLRSCQVLLSDAGSTSQLWSASLGCTHTRKLYKGMELWS